MEVMITYLEMLPLLLKHVEAIISCGSFPYLASHVSCLCTNYLLCCTPYAMICSLSNLFLDL